MFGIQSPTLQLDKFVIPSMIFGILFYTMAVDYFLYIVQTDVRLDSNDKARWTFFLLMWLPFAAVSFWYQFVWRDPVLS